MGSKAAAEHTDGELVFLNPSHTIPSQQKREAIDDSGGDGEQEPPQQLEQPSSSGGAGSVESDRSHVHAPPSLLPRPRSETKGAITGTSSPRMVHGAAADVMSEGPSVAAHESPVVTVATPIAGRPGVCAASVLAVGGGEGELSLQQPPTALSLPSHPSIGEKGGSIGASSAFHQRSERGGERQPLPHAKVSNLAPQQHHVKNPSLASTLATVTSSLSSSTTCSSSLPPRSKVIINQADKAVLSPVYVCSIVI